jgi:hypothetical protein
MKEYKNLIGMIFGKLTVIDIVGKGKNGDRIWLCKCNCPLNKTVEVFGDNLKRGHTTSCGCYKEERVSFARKKYNKYFLENSFGIGYTFKNEEFYFDLEDYNKIKNICWYINDVGYLQSTENDQKIFMHRLIMNCSQNKVIDHKNHITTDNRKNNLRICNQEDNCKNVGISIRNTTGIIGVKWDKNRKKWSSAIMYNLKNKFLGRFDDFEKAIIARLNAEKKYYGEFAPQKHLYKQYGIEE